MINSAAYAAISAKKPLVPYSIERRDPGPHEVLIQEFVNKKLVRVTSIDGPI